MSPNISQVNSLSKGISVGQPEVIEMSRVAVYVSMTCIKDKMARLSGLLMIILIRMANILVDRIIIQKCIDRSEHYDKNKETLLQ